MIWLVKKSKINSKYVNLKPVKVLVWKLECLCEYITDLMNSKVRLKRTRLQGMSSYKELIFIPQSFQKN